MGWHKFLMKRGIGSPGYIAGKLAAAYQSRIGTNRTAQCDERDIIRSIFVERIAAQTVAKGPFQYHLLKVNPNAIEELVNTHPDLFSIVLLSVIIEHPEISGPHAPADTFQVLNETVQETLDTKAPGWRTNGIWSCPNLECSICKEQIAHPDAGTMYASFDDGKNPEYLCAECTMPIDVRAMSDLGYFTDERFRKFLVSNY